MEVMKDNQGKSSLKRWLVIVLVAFSLSSAAVDQYSDEYKSNNTLITAFFGGAMLLIGGTVIEKYKRR